jgi:hypothetical protein
VASAPAAPVSEYGPLCFAILSRGRGPQAGDRYRRGLALAILRLRNDSRVNHGPLEAIWKTEWTRDGSEKAERRECMHVANHSSWSQWRICSTDAAWSATEAAGLGAILHGGRATRRLRRESRLTVAPMPSTEEQGEDGLRGRARYERVRRITNDFRRPAAPTAQRCLRPLEQR